MKKKNEQEPSMAWGSDTSVDEIGDALWAITDGRPIDVAVCLLREDGRFLGFEIATPRQVR